MILNTGENVTANMAQFSESFELSWSDSFYGFADLPSDVLLLILRYLPLPDLANTRLVRFSFIKASKQNYGMGMVFSVTAMSQHERIYVVMG